MKEFMNKDFLLNNDTAKYLYNNVAKKMPIYDYHSHLDPKKIITNKNYPDLGTLMLSLDHYKWLAMSASGVNENIIHSNTNYYEKYMEYAKIIPYAIGNPLFHWTHMELRNILGIDKPLMPSTAQEIWDEANIKLANEEFTPRSILKKSNVKLLSIASDPIDDLWEYRTLQADDSLEIKVLPTFHPDNIVEIEWPGFAEYIHGLEAVSGVKIHCFDDLLDVIERRINFFHENGTRIADHTLSPMPSGDYSLKRANKAFREAMQGNVPSNKNINSYKIAVLVEFAKQYSNKNWVQQYHISGLRNCNTVKLAKYGEEQGFSAMDDSHIAEPLARLLDFEQINGYLPKTILHNLNPSSNEVVASVAGAFQGETRGKIQFGSAWWFGNTREGFERQLQKLASVGMLNTTIGMTTDSRSFLSYTRHEYFRRIICNLIGKLVENGEFINDNKILEKIVADICFNNAKEYFDIDL